MSVMRRQAEVVSVEPVARETFRLHLRVPEIAAQARPGQFVMAGPLNEDFQDPFLGRPFSIHRVTPEGGLQLLFAAVGRGTSALSRVRPGERLWLLGPQGAGFTLQGRANPLILVAGGLGVAPLFFLAEEALRIRRRVLFLFGARSAQQLVALRDLADRGAEVRLATDDGSAGERGTVVELLSRVLDRLPGETFPGAGLGVCGPWPMLQEAARVARERGLPAEISLEVRMACGAGACLGCTVDLPAGKKRVCVDGPVFPATEVFG
jgi:dihydroorotate dehydrogenase electron transfer subunit